MRSHSVTCHPAEVTFPPLLQPKLVLDLATPNGCKAEVRVPNVWHPFLRTGGLLTALAVWAFILDNKHDIWRRSETILSARRKRRGAYCTGPNSRQTTRWTFGVTYLPFASPLIRRLRMRRLEGVDGKRIPSSTMWAVIATSSTAVGGLGLRQWQPTRASTVASLAGHMFVSRPVCTNETYFTLRGTTGTRESSRNGTTVRSLEVGDIQCRQYCTT